MGIIEELRRKKAIAENLNKILIKKIRIKDDWARDNGGREDILKREILKLNPDHCFDESDKFKFKRKIRRRDKFLCCFCKRNILEVSLDESLHHKIPRRYGGKDTMKNQITICFECHRLLEELIGYVEEKALELNSHSHTP